MRLRKPGKTKRSAAKTPRPKRFWAKNPAATTLVGAVAARSIRSAMGNNLEQRVQKIEERNKVVEADKEWETSWTRRILLTLFTYLAIGIYLWVIEISQPWLNAIVPAVAFMISTLTMPWFKKVWLRYVRRRK